MMRSPILLLVVASLLICCDDTSTPPPDDWPLWDGGFEVTPPEAPAPPRLAPCPEGWRERPPDDETGLATCDPWPESDPAAPPVLTPCPEGWREIPPEIEGGASICDPWPTSGEADCTGAEAHFPGEPGCRLVGSVCPAGDWADDLPSDRQVHYVLAGAPPGGDGSREAPFATIGEAMSAARSDAVIALSKGSFDEAVTLSQSVTLWGACVAETLLTCSVPSERTATIYVARRDSEVRNLTLSGRRPGIMVIDSLTSVRLQDLVIAAAQGFALAAGGSTQVMGQDVVIRDTEPRPSDGLLGWGILVESGGRVELERVVLERNQETAVSASGPGTELILSDVVIRDTEPRPRTASGFGLFVRSGAQVEINRGVFERNRFAAVNIFNAGSRAVLNDLLVRDTSAVIDREDGFGLSATEGAEIEANRVALVHNRRLGINATGAGTTLNLSDLVVRDTQRWDFDEVTQRMGHGMWVTGGAQADVSRAAFERNMEYGVYVSAPGTIARFWDLAIRDTQSRDIDGEKGVGFGAEASALVEIDRAVFERNRYAGLYASLAGTIVNARNVVVRDTRPALSEVLSLGVLVQHEAAIDISTGLFEGNRGASLYVWGQGSVLRAEDLVIRDTRCSDNGLNGRGLSAELGGRIELERALLEGNHEIGAFAGVDGAFMTLTDIVIRHTEPNDQGLFGRGLELSAGGSAEVRRALIQNNQEIGIHVSGEDVILILSDVEVRDTQANTAGEYGRGLHAQYGAQVELERGIFDSNREVSIFAIIPGTSLRLSDVVVTRTLVRECAETTCGDYPLGVGVGVYGGASMEMTRFEVSHNPLCGVQLAHGAGLDHARFEEGGVMDLSEGEISFNLIGANVQSEGFDISRLLNDVITHDNERNLDTDELPVPDIGEFL